MKHFNFSDLIPTSYTITVGNNQLLPTIFQLVEHTVNKYYNVNRNCRALGPAQQGQQQQGQQQQKNERFIMWSSGPCRGENIMMSLSSPAGIFQIGGSFTAEDGFHTAIEFPPLSQPQIINTFHKGSLEWGLPKSAIFRTDWVLTNQAFDVNAVLDKQLFKSKSGEGHLMASIPLNNSSPQTLQFTYRGTFDSWKKSGKNQQSCGEKRDLVPVINNPNSKDESKLCDTKIDLSDKSLSKTDFVEKPLMLVFSEINQKILQNELFIVALALTLIKIVVVHRELLINKGGERAGAKTKKKDKYFLIFKLPSLPGFCDTFSSLMMVQVFIPYSHKITHWITGNISNIVLAKPTINAVCCFICRYPGPKAFMQVSTTLITFSSSFAISTIVLKGFEVLAYLGVVAITDILINDESSIETDILINDESLIEKIEKNSEKKAPLGSHDFIDMSLNHVFSNF